ncbi:MAG: M56 family metallopeptidase [Planctomycetaceae bacterium]
MNTRPAFEWLVSQFDVERLGWVLLHSLWQFTLVTLLAAAVVRTLRRKSSALRYGVLVTSMTVSVTAPAVTLMLLPNDRPLPVPSHDAISPMQHVHDALEGSSLPLESEAPSVEMPIAAGDLSIPELQPAEPVQSPAVRQPGPPWSERASMALRPWLAWIVVAWSLGVVICSARPLLGWRTLRRLRRVGVSPVPDEVLATLGQLSRQLGLPNTVQLLQSTLAQMPIVVGYFRPVILLPVSLLTSVPATQLEALLVHELAHIRQHDFVVNLLQVVAETLFFYHPALWWLSHQIRIEREHSCDDLVVQLLGNRVEYGRALVAVEQLRGRVSALALSAGGGTLLSRIRRLGSGPAVESRRLAWCGSIAAILACFIGCTLLFSSTLDRLVKTECARVALPDGSSVALLGVTSDGTDPARWWSADGKPLDGHPLTGHRTTSQPDWGTRRRFAVRSTRSKRVAWFFPSDGEYQSSGSVGDGPDYLREEVIAPLALPSLDPIAVECGVGEGDFGPWSTINLDGNRQPVSETSPELTPFYEQITQQASFVFVENGEEDFTLVIPTYKYIADQEWVVIAKDGRRLPWRVRSEIFSSKYEITFSVPPNGIDHVEFRLRPYRHWVTFKNVSLRRGQITDVKVATAPPRPEAKASSESDPSDGASQRPPFVVTVLTQRKRDKKEGDELWDNELGLINEGGDLIKRFGTGIVIDERGYIATMRHLVSDARTVRVMLSGYRTYDARIVASDVKRGIAVLKIDPPQPLETAKFGTSSTLKKSDSVAIFDGSQGQGSQAAKGSVTELGQLVEVNPQVIYSNLIQTDIPIDPGQSGGPLMNASGEVIGIMVALRTGTQKVSFALPVDDLLPVFKQIVEADAGTASNEKDEAAQGDQTFNAVKEEAQRDIADGRLKFKLYGQLSDPDRKLLGEQGIGIEVLPRNITSDDKKRANFYNQVILDHVVAQLGAGAQADHMRAALNKPNEQLIEQAPDDRSSQEAKVHSEEQEPVVRRPLSPTLVFPDHLNVVAVGFDREGAELVSLSTENDVAVRAWEPDIILRAWGSDRKKPKREVKLDTAKHGNIFLQGQPMLSGDRRHVIAILDRQVTIWDANTGKLVKTLGPPQEMQNSVLRNLTATPDLALVACGRAPGFSGIDIADADAIVWDVAAGRVLRTVSHAKALQIQSVAMSPDGKFFATGGQEAGLCLWDLGTGKLLYQLPNENAGKQHPNPEVSAGGANQVLSLRFSPDGKQLALGDMLGVKMLEASTGKLLFQCEAPFRYGRSGFVFSKDGQMFARIATDKTVPIWSARTGTLLAELPTESHDGTFSGDNRSLVVGFTDSKLGLAVWPLVSGTAKPNTNSMNATPLQRLVAQFSSGHRIEFVGMTRNTLSAKSGWRPDGQAMGDVPEFKATLGGRRANGEFAGTAPVEDENARDFLFEFRGLRDEPSVHFELPFGTPIYAQEPIRDSHLRIRVFASPQDKKHPYSDPASPPQPHKLRVGLTDEPWGPWQQISATGQLLNNLGKNKLYQSHYSQIGFRIGSGGGLPDDTLLVLRHPRQHDRLYAFEMRAIDTEGEVVRGLDWRRQDVEGTALEDSGWYLTQPLPLGKKLARFEYRLRPYRDWVTFENVSLVPGQQTDVKVTTDSLPEDKPRAAIEAVEPARDATNDPDPKTDQPNNTNKPQISESVEEPDDKPRPLFGVWGPKANGLRARIIPVQSSIQDEALKVPQRVTKFATVEDVAFVVELQNVSDQPIKLVDVWRDVKTETPIQDANWLSQFVCSVVLVNRNGTWIETAGVEVADAEFVLHDSQVRTLQPGTKYQFLIKPARWLAALQPQLQAGPYRVAVSYRWPAGPHAAKNSEANPGKKFSEVAPISIVAGAVEIEVGGENRQPDLVWGEAVNGLRAALSFKTSNATHSHGERLDVRLHLQNVSTQRLKLVSDLSQPVTAATIKDELVQKVNKVDEDDGGLAPSINGLVTLGPQQIVVLDAGNIGLAGSEEQASRFDDKTVRKLIAPAGKYSMQLETSFKNVLTQRIVVPGQEVMRVQDAWTGKLKTGATPLVVEEGKKNAAAKQVVEVRLVGGPKSEPLPNVKVEFTTGHGGDRISLGSFTTDDAGQLKAELPVGFYYLHLSSEKEWPFLPFEKNWTGSSFGHSKELNIHVTEQRVEKWIDGQRCERGFEAATKERSARITFTLEPAVEFVLRAVDIETGQGIPGAEFYEENAAAEDWAHRIYGENIGSKFASSTKSTPASDDLTDNEGYLRRWVGERSAESTFGVQKPPKGYKLIEPKAEVALPTKLGQSRAEQVFRFCRIRWDVQVEPEKKKFVLGTPISLTFTVINRTNEACGLELGSEHKHQLGRRDAIEIAVINNDSKQLPIPEPAASLDGITRPELLVPNGEAKATLLLSDWATITQPGTYRVFVKQKLKLFPIKSQQNGQIKWGDTPEIAAVEASCELEVITPVAAQFDLLQGEWALKAWQEEGVEESVYASADELKGKKLLINGNVMSGVGSGIGGSMSFKLNSEKTPNEIDLTVLDGKRKGITEPGIYKIEGDQLRICFGGKIRPKEFATTPGSGHTLLTLQKESLTAWGNEVGGLQAGLGFRPGEHRVYHPGEAVKLVLRVRNVGKEAVEFKHIRAFFIENPPKITDADGKIVELPNYRTRDQESHTARSNNVLPGKEVDLHEWAFDLQPKIEHSSRSFIPGTGQFSIQCGRIVGPTWLNPNHPNPTSDKLATGMLKLEVKDAKKLSDAPPKEPPTAWGKEAGGLQAGLSISNASDVRIGGKVTLVLKLRNVSNDPITTSAWPLWLIKPTIVDGAGKHVRTTSPSSPGFDLSTTDITLKPGQTVVVATNSIFVVDAEAKGGVRHEGVADQFTIHVHPGRHRIDLKGFLEGRPTVATGTVEFEVKADKQEKPDAPAAKPNNDPANDEKPEEKPQEPGAKQELPMPSEAKLRVEGVDKRVLAALIARKENDGIPVVVEVTDFKVVEKFDAKLFEQP